MFCHRHFVAFFLLLSLVFTPILLPVENSIVIAQDESQEHASEHQTLEIEKKPQRIFAPHWTTEATYSTTLYIRNVHFTQPVIAKVSLILDDRTIALPDTFVDSLQTVSIDVEKALLDNGETPEQSGGAVIDFEAESAGAINAYAQVLDTTRSLSFSFPFTQDGAPAPGPLDAVAWYYSKRTDALVALQNTTDGEVSASTTIFAAGRPIDLGKRHLKPHEVVIVKIASPEELGNETGPRSAGVRVEYDGNPGAVVVQGWVVDESIGFSAPFAFHPKSNCGCATDTQHKYGAGIMIGKGGMALPPPGFSPYLVMSNSSDKPLTVSPVFSYVLNDKNERKTLPRIALGPRTTTVVNLRDFQDQGVIPSVVEMGDIDVQYKGEAGSLIAELASVDQNGSFVSPVRLICSGNRDLHMAFWRADADWHSSITIENIASEENDIEVTISYPGGIYVLEEQISAGASGMISINELQQSQQPDALGRRIPKDATLGGVNIWSTNIHDGLVINAMLMNPVTKTCGQCTEPGYVMQYTVSDKAAYTGSPLYSGFDPHVVGLGFPIYINVLYSSGSHTQSGDAAQSSTSSNTSVATATGSYVTAVAPGATNITANSRSGYFTNTACSQPGYLLPSRVSSLTVIPAVTISGPGTVPLDSSGQSGVDKSIRLTATVNPSGGTFSWNTPSTMVSLSNATSATVTVTSVSASTSRSDVKITVSYTVNNQSASAKTWITVVKPTSLALTSNTINATGHTCNPSAPMNSCQTSAFSGNGSYSSYVRTITYNVMDQFNPPQVITGFNLYISESFTPLQGQCAGGTIITGSGMGQSISDCFYFCAETCRTGGNCNVSATQTLFVNGFSVASKSVNWTCTGVTVQ